jgi:protein O-mannosyl-transferase
MAGVPLEPLPTDRAHPPRAALVLAAVLLIVAAVYSPVVAGGFVWDDQMIAARGQRVEQIRGISDYFGQSFWADYAPSERQDSFYRPIVTLSFALDARVHFGNPAGFHLTNLLLHLGVVGLLFARLRSFGVRTVSSGVLSLLFGLVPRLAESVAWISGRTDLLAMLFSLLALQLAVPPSPSRQLRAWREVGLAACLLAALFSKEIAAVGVVALAIHAWSLPTRRARLTRSGLLAACALSYAVLRYRALAHLEPAAPFPGTALDRVTVVLEAVARYAYMTLWPFQPQSQIGLLAQPQTRWAIAGAVVLLGGAIVAWRRARPRVLVSAQGVHLLLTVLPVLLVLHLWPLPINVVAADRYLYVPLLGLVLSAAPAFDRWLARSGRRGQLVLAGLLIPAAAAAPITRARAVLWGDDIAFWEDAIRTSFAANPQPRSQLGNLFYEEALFDEAYRTYLTITPTFVSARNTATALRRLGRCEESSRLWDRIFADTTARAALPSDFVSAARSAICLGRFAQARAIAGRGLAANPNHAAIVAVLADVDYVASTEDETPLGVGAAATERWADVLLRAGRDPETVAAWATIAAAPDATPAQVERAALFLLRFGPLPAAAAAVTRASAEQTGTAGSLRVALEERRARSERLLALVPLATSAP